MSALGDELHTTVGLLCRYIAAATAVQLCIITVPYIGYIIKHKNSSVFR